MHPIEPGLPVGGIWSYAQSASCVEQRRGEVADDVDAYDERTLARLRAAIRTYDPNGVIAIGHALSA